VKYLSYGAGVDSTALLILGGYDEAVFVNHGGDYPETYAFLEAIQQRYPVTVLTPQVEGCSTIEEYCKKYGLIPLRQMRWCTHKFKIRPMYAYFQRPCEVWIGISYDEKHRATGKTQKNVTLRYPLVEQRITRNQAKQIIKDAGLEIPRKSGCWFCPFQSRRAFRRLKGNYPELFARALEMENGSTATFKNRPLSVLNQCSELNIREIR